VHITLSAMILTERWTSAFGALSTLCFGLLFRIYRPIPVLEMQHPPGHEPPRHRHVDVELAAALAGAATSGWSEMPITV
jgi:hypothetical protein